MICFVIICGTKKIKAKYGGIKDIEYLVTNRGRLLRVMLHVGPGHSNNCQIILKLLSVLIPQLYYI